MSKRRYVAAKRSERAAEHCKKLGIRLHAEVAAEAAEAAGQATTRLSGALNAGDEVDAEATAELGTASHRAIEAARDAKPNHSFHSSPPPPPPQPLTAA